MKIKVFQFEVSNGSSMPCSDDDKKAWFVESLRRLDSPAKIEQTINDFTEYIASIGKEVVGIKINNVDVQYHNNARGNTIRLIYTVIYK